MGFVGLKFSGKAVLFMAANVISIENSKKNYTQKERTARAKAEAALSRPKVTLKPPDFVKNNLVALGHWKATIKRMKGISLLDDLDTDMLAIYCVQLVRREELEKLCGEDADMIARLQAQERSILQYAEKLGLTPSGRVRLAKRRAEASEIDENGDLFGG